MKRSDVWFALLQRYSCGVDRIPPYYEAQGAMERDLDGDYVRLDDVKGLLVAMGLLDSAEAKGTK